MEAELPIPGPSSREDVLARSFPEDLVWSAIRNEEAFPLNSGLRFTEAVLRAAEALSPGLLDSPLSVAARSDADSRLRKVDEGTRALERRLRELERERRDVLQALKQLEVGAARGAGARLAERIAEAELPDPRDLVALDLLTRELRLAAEQDRLVEELEKRNRAMENVLSQTKDIVASAPWLQDAVKLLPRTAKKKIRFHDVGEMKVFSLFDEPREVRRARAVSFPIESEDNLRSISSEMRKEEEAIPVQLSTLLVEAKESLSEAENEVSVSTADAENQLINEDTTKKGDLNMRQERKEGEEMASLDYGRELKTPLKETVTKSSSNLTKESSDEGALRHEEKTVLEVSGTKRPTYLQKVGFDDGRKLKAEENCDHGRELRDEEKIPLRAPGIKRSPDLMKDIFDDRKVSRNEEKKSPNASGTKGPPNPKSVSIDDGRELRGEERTPLKATKHPPGLAKDEPLSGRDEALRNSLGRLFEQIEIIKDLNKDIPEILPRNDDTTGAVDLCTKVNEDNLGVVSLAPENTEENNTKILKLQNEKPIREKEEEVKSVDNEFHKHTEDLEKNAEIERQKGSQTERYETEDKGRINETSALVQNKENIEVQMSINEREGKGLENMGEMRKVDKLEELEMIEEIWRRGLLEDATRILSEPDNDLNPNRESDGLCIQKSNFEKEDKAKPKATKLEKENESRDKLSKTSKEKKQTALRGNNSSTSHNFPSEYNEANNSKLIQSSSETGSRDDLLSKYRVMHLPSIVLVDIEEEISKISDIQMKEYIEEQRVVELAEEGKPLEMLPYTTVLSNTKEGPNLTQDEQSRGAQGMDTLSCDPQDGSSQIHANQDSPNSDLEQRGSDDGNCFDNKSDSHQNK